MNNIQIIVNNGAGTGSAVAVWKETKEYLQENGISYNAYLTRYEKHAVKLAGQICGKIPEGPIYLLVVGGDGTINEVLNGIIGCNNVNLGIIPCGSGNDFVKYFEDPAAFLDLGNLLHGEIVPLDVIRMGDRVAVNSCSVGMDAMVADHVRHFKKLPISASLAYKLSCVYTAFKKFRNDLEITIDGRKLGKIPCLFAACANAPFYGGGFRCAPTACPGDGKLEYSIIECRSKLQMIKILGRYRKGTHITLENCRYGNCSQMEISSSRPMVINMDGEIFHDTHAKFELVKGAVRLILPRSLVGRFLPEFQMIKGSACID